jgi:hypothetical protein
MKNENDLQQFFTASSGWPSFSGPRMPSIALIRRHIAIPRPSPGQPLGPRGRRTTSSLLRQTSTLAHICLTPIGTTCPTDSPNGAPPEQHVLPQSNLRPHPHTIAPTLYIYPTTAAEDHPPTWNAPTSPHKTSTTPSQ